MKTSAELESEILSGIFAREFKVINNGFTQSFGDTVADLIKDADEDDVAEVVIGQLRFYIAYMAKEIKRLLESRGQETFTPEEVYQMIRTFRACVPAPK